MKIVIVSGSSRQNSQSHKISLWVEAKLKALGAETFVVALHEIDLPIHENLDVDSLDEAPGALKAWKPIRNHLQEADGFVFVAPEWDGMTAPALLNFILYCSADETKPLAHKPIQLITASSGAGGAYPTALLHSFGMKNAQGVYLPNYVIIRKCKEVFNSPSPENGNESDVYLQARAEHGLKILLQYAVQLRPIRENPAADLHAYPNGM